SAALLMDPVFAISTAYFKWSRFKDGTPPFLAFSLVYHGFARFPRHISLKIYLYALFTIPKAPWFVKIIT
ncbi:MAG: hypothetical protein LBT59_13130, partial [Clostridiales bacterium]|nr:hypothetical protein [Clostridiales bacterium]